MKLTDKRLVITGMGVVSSFGSDLKSFWENIREGVSGVEQIDWAKEKGYNSYIAAPVKGFNWRDFFEIKEKKFIDDYATYAIAATNMAIEDSGIDWSRLFNSSSKAYRSSSVSVINFLQKRN